MTVNTVFDDLYIPDFSGYTRKPYNNRCEPTKPSQFIIEYIDSETSITPDIRSIFRGRYGLLLRYRRENDYKHHEPRPAYLLGFNHLEEHAINITQYQQLDDKHVAHRVGASFDCALFFSDIVKSLIQKGYCITMDQFDNDESEGAGFQIGARTRYEALYKRIMRE